MGNSIPFLLSFFLTHKDDDLITIQGAFNLIQFYVKKNRYQIKIILIPLKMQCIHIHTLLTAFRKRDDINIFPSSRLRICEECNMRFFMCSNARRRSWRNAPTRKLHTFFNRQHHLQKNTSAYSSLLCWGTCALF